MRLLFIVLASCVLLFAGDVFAITDEEIFRNFQFSIVNPGARSGAMGGAFIGLADDATAAEANPAGLTILTKPEVSLEYRNTESDASRLNAFNVIEEEGSFLSVASFNTIEELNQPSFVSISYPFGRMTIAFSRQEVSRTEGGLDEVFLLQVPGFPQFLFGTTATQEQKIVNYNFSLGSKLTERFSVGATVRYSQLDWQSEVTNALIEGNQALLLSATDIDDDDSAIAWNAGALYSGGVFSFGAVYKKNPKFEVEEDEFGPLVGQPNTFVNVLKVPDTFGLGVAVRPNDNITVVADVVRVENSDLVEDIVVGRNVFFALLGLGDDDIVYSIDDAWDFNLGTEFVVFAGKVPVALRTGYYRRSSSSLIVESAPALTPAGLATAQALFTEREDENHFTIGNGFVFGPHFQIDWALDLSNLADQFILSSVVRF